MPAFGKRDPLLKVQRIIDSIDANEDILSSAIPHGGRG